VPADWSALENAIRTWVKTGSGLSDTLVIWANQDGPRPTSQHATILIGADTPVGAAPAVTHAYDEDADTGEEITITAREVSELAVTVQILGGAATTSSNARALAKKTQVALGLPTVRAALKAAGLSCFDRGKVESVPEVLDADYEARAVLDVRFYIADDASEVIGYIATVEIEDLDTGTIYTVES
jgi:hypothetical protein